MRSISIGIGAATLVSIFAATESAHAQSPVEAAVPRTPSGINAPVPPAVMVRDDEGHVTLRAVRVATPIRLDGVLDEEIYAATPAIGTSSRTIRRLASRPPRRRRCGCSSTGTRST